METWRRTNLERWNLDQLEGSTHTIADHRSSRSLDRQPVADHHENGVVLTDLETAARTHQALLAPVLEEFWAGEDFRKMELANKALWRGGKFIYVPDGVKAVVPVRLICKSGEGNFSFSRNVVVVGEGSEVVVLEDHQSETTEPQSSVAFSRLILKSGAKAHFFYTQELNAQTAHFWHQKCTLEREAQLFHTSVIMGGGVHKSHLEVELSGQGARSELFGILLGKKEQHFDIGTYQHHLGDHTYSDLLFKSALKDGARSIYTGFIKVEKQALETNAYQANHNLLLSERARADSTPVLEILTNAVHCKHGATAGPLGSEELFYLQSRGLSEPEAEKMLIGGFFEPILRKLPMLEMRERLAARVAEAL
ncbi:MAG: Fe-S cluster assembly protein SufD [Elusimicrobia bacterium]|nr:Fe-S cluster assembly protein SufD [Elusimicrobiota bacterium]